MASPVAADELLVFSAISLKAPMDAIAAEDGLGTPIRVAYGASSALARQIENGAPADLFISAHPEWAARVAQGRESVVIAATGLILAGQQPGQVPLTPDGMNAALGGGLLAMPFPQAVPLGRYARQAFTNLDLWDGLKGRIAETENAAATYALLRRGQVNLAVLYASYATQDPGLHVKARIDPALHDPIRYVAVALTPQGAQALPQLHGTPAQTALRSAGFEPVAP